MTRADDLEAAFPLTPVSYGQYGPTRSYPIALTDDDAWAQRPRHHAVTQPATAPAAVVAIADTTPTAPARFDAVTHGPAVLNAPARGTATKMSGAQADIIAWALDNNSGIVIRGGAHHQATVAQLRAMEKRGFVTLTYGSRPNSPAYGTVTSLGERTSRQVISRRTA